VCVCVCACARKGDMYLEKIPHDNPTAYEENLIALVLMEIAMG